MLILPDFKRKKEQKEKIAMLTAYDYYSAKLAAISGIDILLVGDSLGMVVKGDTNTLNVSVGDIVYHTKAVRKGAPNTFIVADMPYMSYHISTAETKKNAAKLIRAGGADAVKLEGGSASRIEAIRSIVDCEIPVVGHLGLTPQSVNKFGGYKVQGKESEDAEKIIAQAYEIEVAGAFMLVLEAVPESLAQKVTHNLSIPVIGIGAGRYTDGQVLVYHDIMGLSDQKAKFSKIFADIAELESKAITQYIDEVRREAFPERKHTYYPIENTNKE